MSCTSDESNCSEDNNNDLIVETPENIYYMTCQDIDSIICDHSRQNVTPSSPLRRTFKVTKEKFQEFGEYSGTLGGRLTGPLGEVPTAREKWGILKQGFEKFGGRVEGGVSQTFEEMRGHLKVSIIFIKL